MMWEYNIYLFLLAIRYRLLKHTRLNVVAFLNELPKTQHDIASFTIDVNTYTVKLMSVLTVSVLFFKLEITRFILQNSSSLTEHTTSIHS